MNNTMIIEKGTLEAYVGNESHVVIPDGVTCIEEQAFMGSDIESIDIANSVTTIGCQAFANCGNLKEITLPTSLTAVYAEAFLHCKNLEKVIIPSSVKSIGAYAFEGTPWLESQRKTNPLVVVNGLLIDGKEYAESILIIPEHIEKIGVCAFEGNDHIKEVAIPEGVTTIGDFAFRNCKQLRQVSLAESESAIAIGERAFLNCHDLDSVINLNDNMQIGECAFMNTSFPYYKPSL